jgi:hypothetical protein
MSRKPIVGTILFTFLFAISCNLGHEASGPTYDLTSCSLKAKTDNEVQYIITRNSKGLPVQLDFIFLTLGSSSTCAIEYDASDNIVKMSQDNGYFSYEYGADNKPIARARYNRTDASSPFEKMEQIFYRYNSQGMIDSITYDGNNHYERFEYDAAGNVVKTYLKNYAPEVLDHEFLVFDDKKNPEVDANFVTYSIPGNGGLTGLNLPLISEHNILSEKFRVGSGSIVNRTFTYNYNYIGYPANCKETYMTYSYNCK